MLYLILIFAIIFAIFSWLRLNWSVATIVLLLPTYLIRFEVAGIPMTLLELMILIVFVVWFLKVVIGKQKISFSKYKWWILSLLLIVTLSVFVSESRLAAWGIWKAYFVEPVLFFLVLINTVKTKKEWGLIVGALFFSALGVAIPAIIQKFTGWCIPNEFWRAEGTRRVTSWFGYPNAVGLYLAPIAMFFAGLLMQGKIRVIETFKKTKKIKVCWQSILSFVFFIVALLAIVFAGSEGAIIGLAAGLIFLGLIYPYRLTRLATIIVLFFCFLAFLFIPSIHNYALEKFTMSDRSGQIRVQQWKETWAMLQDDHQIMGGGLANYQTAIKPYHAEGVWIKDKNDSAWLEKIRTSEEFRIKNWQPTEIYLYPHNVLFNFWSEIGLFGASIFLILVLKFLSGYWLVRGKETLAQESKRC